MNNYTYSDAGLALTKQFEGLRLEAYQDSGGVWTIGYGHTGFVNEGDRITEEEADALLMKDVEWAERCVCLNTKATLTQCQFDALVDFTFNLGCHAFANSSLCIYAHIGKWDAAADEFLRWNHVNGKVVEGLTRRREAERKMFLGESQ